MDSNCYIYFDGDDVPIKERRVHVQCHECYIKNKKGKLWRASNGYGNWEIKCSCGKIIKEGENA